MTARPSVHPLSRSARPSGAVGRLSRRNLGLLEVAPLFGAYTSTLDDATRTRLPATTLTFIASSAGRVTYLCSVPGHAAEGMYGRFVVLATT